MPRNNQFFQLKSDCIDPQTSDWFNAQNQGQFVATSALDCIITGLQKSWPIWSISIYAMTRIPFFDYLSV